MSILLKQWATGIAGGNQWSSYWATLISATVENAAPTHVVLTFPTANTNVTSADFTIDGWTISSGSWAGNVLTLVLSVGMSFYEGNFLITFAKTGTTAEVTNNIANDGKTIVWYDAADLSTITKDGANLISQMNDKLASGRNLVQAVEASMPTHNTDEIVSNLKKLTASSIPLISQPVMAYFLVKINKHVNGGGLFHTANLRMQQSNTANNIYASAGSVGANIPITLGSYFILKVQYHGAGSWVQIDNGVKDTTNLGTSFGNSTLNIGFRDNDSYISNITWKAFILRIIDESDETAASISAYLEKKK